MVVESVRALQLAFRKEFDQTPSGWLKAQRLERAKRLLAAGSPSETTVSQVAESVGMHHFGNFSVDFRRWFGVSPSEVLRSKP